ncbi:MAG: SDR family NAD(P)-dependent oxidoreductase [Proteobacteria bacterium]|nr:SDR family NAD(P)-dependent oxidoreductase [Pseudomonadota bacterium]
MTKPVCAVVGIGPQNGASFARRFAAEGYAIALLSRKTEYSSKLAAEIDSAKVYACDVTDPSAVEAAFATVRAEMGEIDVLVYNAGSGVWGNIEELSAHDFEQSWRINTMGAFLVSKQVIPSMKEKKTGSIIFIGATASLRGRPFTTAFAPAKAAQRSLAQAMAKHLWPSGIHVSLIIIDGGVKSLDLDANVEAPETLDPDDIATTAYFLSQQPRSAWSFEVDVRPSRESW